MNANTTAADMTLEAEREYTDRFAPAATLTDAHTEWHAVHGALAVCPMDCGAGEAAMAHYEQEAAPLVRCGYCKCLETIAEVRECSAAAHQTGDLPGFKINPSRHDVRIVCRTCGEGKTGSFARAWAHSHGHGEN